MNLSPASNPATCCTRLLAPQEIQKLDTVSCEIPDASAMKLLILPRKRIRRIGATVAHVFLSAPKKSQENSAKEANYDASDPGNHLSHEVLVGNGGQD